MHDRRIKIGKDPKGRFSVQLSIAKDDPLKPYILALAKKAAHTVQDPTTGFSYEQEPKDGSQVELEEILMKLLPDELSHKFATESAELKDEAMQSMMGGDLGGLLGLMTGGFFQQQAALKSNPNLTGLQKLAGNMTDPFNKLLGGSVFANHARDQIHAGAFDSILKPSAATPEPTEAPFKDREED